MSADPGSITAIELGLDAARMAQMWVALLTGGIDARGRGTIGDDVRDATGRVPILCFQETDEHATPRQRFSLDVWVGPGVADQRIAAPSPQAGRSWTTARRPPTRSSPTRTATRRACARRFQRRGRLDKFQPPTAIQRL